MKTNFRNASFVVAILSFAQQSRAEFCNFEPQTDTAFNYGGCATLLDENEMCAGGELGVAEMVLYERVDYSCSPNCPASTIFHCVDDITGPRELCRLDPEYEGFASCTVKVALCGCLQAEVCGDGVDNNSNSAVEESCLVSQDGECSLAGMPVSLHSREMFVGPHVLTEIDSGVSPLHDIVFDIQYDSQRAKQDVAPITAPAAEQNNYVHPLGPGWRHRYDDRLRLVSESGAGMPANPQSIEWERMGEVVRLLRSGGDPSADYVGEAGSNIRARRLGGTPTRWRIRDGGGDIYEFKELASTLHPLQADRYYAKLTRFRPGSATGYSVLVQHEDDAQAANCTGIVPGATSCVPSRGLLARVAVEWDPDPTVGGDEQSGASIELKYDSSQHLKEVRATTTTTPVALAALTFVGAQLIRVDDAEMCPVGPAPVDGCLIRKYGYELSPNLHLLSSVSRFVLFDSGVGGAGALTPEETFTWQDTGAQGFKVSAHKSPGTTLAAPTTSSASATWTRNGVSETTTFGATGQVASCDGGRCGASPRQYQTTTTSAVYALGASFVRTNEGIDVHQQFNENGLVIFECEVVPSGSGSSVCALSSTTGAVTVSLGTLRKARRSYYRGQGGRDELISVAVEWIGNSDATSNARFPLSTDASTNWFNTAATGLPNCPSPAPLSAISDPSVPGRTHFYDVLVFDRESNGTTPLNQVPAADLAFPAGLGDVAIARITGASSSLNGGVVTSRLSCSASPRDNALRIGAGSVNEQRRFGTPPVLVAEDDRDYEAVTASSAKIRGRLKAMTHIADVGAPTDKVVEWQTCATGTLGGANAVDARGRLVCVEVPQTPAALRIEETSAADTAFERSRRTTISYLPSGGSSIYSTESIITASGLPLKTRTVGGNSRHYRYANDDAAKGPVLTKVIERLADGTDFASVTQTYTGFGFPDVVSVLNGAGLLRAKHDLNSSHDQFGRPATVKDSITTSSTVSTSFTHTSWGAVATRVDPDDQSTTRKHEFLYVDGVSGGDPINGLGRLSEVKIAGTTARHNLYTRRGELKSFRHFASGSAATSYEYDGFGQLIRESLNSAIVDRRYAYTDLGQIGQIDTGPLGFSTPTRRLFLAHDDLGRILTRCETSSCTGATDELFKYDSKGTFVSPGGCSTVVNDNNQKGRLAYFKDEGGATFFQYDVMGRITAVVRNNGVLTAPLTCSSLSKVAYTYSLSGAVATITYPSGRLLQYTFDPNKDLDRPSGILWEFMPGMFATIANQITYEPSGQPKTWVWGGYNASHEVDRDLSGRVTEIEDEWNNTAVSRLTYNAYEADGDLTSETDVIAPTMHVSNPASANVTRTYTYDVARDWLRSWTGKFGAVTRNFAGNSLPTFEVGPAFPTFPPSSPSAVLTFFYSGERIVAKYNPSVITFDAVNNIVPNEIGEATSISRTFAPSGSIIHGKLGEVQSVNVSGLGVISNDYDAFMRRLKKSGPTANDSTVWRYGLADVPLEETFTNASAFNQTETIYLAGAPIAFYVTVGNPGGGLTTHATAYALTDRMGIVRKTRSGNSSLNRLVMDAAGRGTVQVDGAGTNVPLLGWRYPGQYQDSETGLINNRWRTLIPETGTYTSPEPLHALTSAGFTGAQSFRYADGRPTRLSDSRGLDVDGWEAALGFGLIDEATYHDAQQAALAGSALSVGAVGMLVGIESVGAFTVVSAGINAFRATAQRSATKAWVKLAGTGVGSWLLARGQSCQESCGCAQSDRIVKLMESVRASCPNGQCDDLSRRLLAQLGSGNANLVTLFPKGSGPLPTLPGVTQSPWAYHTGVQLQNGQVADTLMQRVFPSLQAFQQATVGSNPVMVMVNGVVQGN